jgi:hypothetical protein
MTDKRMEAAARAIRDFSEDKGPFMPPEHLAKAALAAADAVDDRIVLTHEASEKVSDHIGKVMSDMIVHGVSMTRIDLDDTGQRAREILTKHEVKNV